MTETNESKSKEQKQPEQGVNFTFQDVFMLLKAVEIADSRKTYSELELQGIAPAFEKVKTALETANKANQPAGEKKSKGDTIKAPKKATGTKTQDKKDKK